MSWYNIKLVPENISLRKWNDGSYLITDMYLDNNRFYGYKDSFNYYDIDVDKIIVYKKVTMNILLDIIM